MDAPAPAGTTAVMQMNPAQAQIDTSQAGDTPQPGDTRLIDGHPRRYVDGYWVKIYEPPADTLRAKKQLIEALTRRLFNHVEHGINVPGRRLDEARAAFETETDPARRRVKGAMLAGALFNRATDIFTKLMELQELGVQIQTDNALMRECGQCLKEALSLGKLVLHRSGEEGIDELWGEPFRAFSIPVEAFYDSRYIKIAQTMRDIDRIAATLIATFDPLPLFRGIAPLVRRFSDAARRKTETLRTDPDIFDVWTDFVVASEALTSFEPHLALPAEPVHERSVDDGRRLISVGCDLVSYISRARTPMPKSTKEFIARCEHYRLMHAPDAR